MNSQELLTYIEMIRGKIDTQKLIVFVGAGVSKNVQGMPDWHGLVRKMAENIGYTRCASCWHKTDVCQEDCVFQYDYTPDELLKIPQHVYNVDPSLYYSILRESISAEQIDAPMSKVIFDLNPAHIITTNFDKLIESSSHPTRESYEVIVRDGDLLKAKKSRYIIKMHGDIEEKNLHEIVLKEADFLEYAQRHVLIELFVKSLLADHTILFLGYSMNDYNIKLIISWLNYIRAQNSELLDVGTRIGYIVQDSDFVTERDAIYFAKNHIGIINLHKMPLLEAIPESITHDIGKRLYSFLSVLHNERLEMVLGRDLVYDNAVVFMSQFPYVDFRTIAELLHVDRYILEYGRVTLLTADDYTSLVEYFNSETDNAKRLAFFFYRAGIRKLTHHHEKITFRVDEYLVPASEELNDYTTALYRLYLHNQYVELSKSLDLLDSPEKLFYCVLSEGYTSRMQNALCKVNASTLSESERIAYLINKATLQALRTWKFDGTAATICFENITSKRIKHVLKPLKDLLSGNAALQMRIKECLDKVKEHYAPQSRVVGGDLAYFMRLKGYAYDAYALFFAFHLFFERTSDLRLLLYPYIEGMLLTNGRKCDEEGVDPDFPLHSIRKKRYCLNIIDIDMLTKFIAPKKLDELVTEYQVEKLSIDLGCVDTIVDGFVNITKAMLHSGFYHDHTFPKAFVNYCILLPLIELTQEQKGRVSAFLDELFNELDFINNFFSIRFIEWRLALSALTDLVKYVGVKTNTNMIRMLTSHEKFGEYCANTSRHTLSILLRMFIDVNSPNAQEEIGAILKGLPELTRIATLHLIKNCVTDDVVLKENKEFLKQHFDKLHGSVLIDFVLGEWIVIEKADGQKLIADVLAAAQQQHNGMHIIPDPVRTRLDVVYILHICGCLEDISALSELAPQEPILQFLIDDQSVDYSKVDFGNYMWANVARRKRYMDKLIEHKAEIIPKLRQKVDRGTASDFECKVLYGYLLGENSIELA